MSEQPFKPLGKPIALTMKITSEDVDRAIRRSSKALRPFLTAKPLKAREFLS